MTRSGGTFGSTIWVEPRHHNAYHNAYHESARLYLGYVNKLSTDEHFRGHSAELIAFEFSLRVIMAQKFWFKVF